jgi:hypothetical protein
MGVRPDAPTNETIVLATFSQTVQVFEAAPSSKTKGPFGCSEEAFHRFSFSF